MRILLLIVGCFGLAACAGRDPQPVATVQLQDQSASCAQLVGEIQANNLKIQELATEKG